MTKWFFYGFIISVLFGCGEHPESKARRERIRSFHVPQEAEPAKKPDVTKNDAPLWTPSDKVTSGVAELIEMEDRLIATQKRLAASEAALAAATKGGYTGCKFYTSANCGPCKLLKAHLKAKGWTVGPSDKFHFWEIDTDDADKHPLVPHLVYFNDGKQMKGEIVGYDGSEKSLLQIIAKQPVSHKTPPAKSAAVNPAADPFVPDQIIYSNEVIYYEPAPVYVETVYPASMYWQVGPFYGAVW